MTFSSNKEPDTYQRWDEIKALWRDREIQRKYAFILGLFLVIIAVLVGGVLLPLAQRDEYIISIYTNAIAIAFGVFVLDSLAEAREAKLDKQRIIRDMGSQSGSFAGRAIEMARKEGFLVDGSLEKVHFYNADWSGCYVYGRPLDHTMKPIENVPLARLNGIKLEDARLIDTKLCHCDIKEGVFVRTIMCRSNLYGSNLANCVFRDADLYGAELGMTIFYGADLTEVNLENADLGFTVRADGKTHPARFDSKTILPDGTFYVDNADLERFTNPIHPNFWRSLNPEWPPRKHNRQEHHHP